MNHTKAVFQSAPVKAQKKYFQLLSYSPPYPLNKGGGERSNENDKSANLPNDFVYDCRSYTKIYGDRAFAVNVLREWNLIPYEIRKSNTISNFKRSLKIIVSIDLHILL